MGYLSQRKKSRRQQLLIKTMVVFIGIYNFLLFFNSVDFGLFGFLKNYLFQVYLVSLCLCVYAGLLRYWGAGVFFCACLFMQYGYLSASTNLFINTKIEDGTNITLISRRGSAINLVPYHHLGKNYTIINIDFSKMSAQSRQKAFKNLKTIVSEQDNPVILYGDFGETSWSRSFKVFMNQTGLQVKSKIKLFSCDYLFNPLAVPTFYVLAFANVGVEDVDIIPPKGKGCAFAVSKLKVR